MKQSSAAEHADIEWLGSRNTISVSSADAVLPATDIETDVKTQPPWNVILYNDDVHAFDDVILWVQKSCGCSLEKAIHITYEAHVSGRAIAYDGTQARCTSVCGALRRHGLQALDFSDNEMAKLHIRHLVGGHAPQAAHEMLYRFEFPERPGALINFLHSMSQSWNISLFHYRNHGTDIGRVLVGIQVAPEDYPDFQNFLEKVGYPSYEESHNPAYRLFLS